MLLIVLERRMPLSRSVYITARRAHVTVFLPAASDHNLSLNGEHLKIIRKTSVVVTQGNYLPCLRKPFSPQKEALKGFVVRANPNCVRARRTQNLPWMNGGDVGDAAFHKVIGGPMNPTTQDN